MIFTNFETGIQYWLNMAAGNCGGFGVGVSGYATTGTKTWFACTGWRHYPAQTRITKP